MDRQAATKQMKALKAKAKAARKEGKGALAATFRLGSARLQRKLKATAPRAKKGGEKKDEAAPAAAPAAQG
jgi:hypothetical protein